MGSAPTAALPCLTSWAEWLDFSGDQVLAAGVFDGVHRGHQAVIGRAVELAPKLGPNVQAGVLTFSPHPTAVLRPESSPLLLTPGKEKSAHLAACGIDFILELPFTPELAALPAEDFLALLAPNRGLDKGQLRGVCCGQDWTFGYRRQGDLAYLRTAGDRLGFQVQGVAPLLDGPAPISSTRIRHALAAGALDEVERLLGRPYELVGTVVQGRQLGRKLGFPTANLPLPPNKALPPLGVYAVDGQTANGLFCGVANLGLRPTVDSGSVAPTFEVHLFDAVEDLYGQTLRVRLRQHLRSEQAFSSLEALQAQIATDTRQARAFFQA
jgi:riboflavin kinase / FMN adenylyltransferase